MVGALILGTPNEFQNALLNGAAGNRCKAASSSRSQRIVSMPLCSNSACVLPEENLATPITRRFVPARSKAFFAMRAKLGPSAGDLIETVRNLGYKMRSRGR